MRKRRGIHQTQRGPVRTQTDASYHEKLANAAREDLIERLTQTERRISKAARDKDKNGHMKDLENHLQGSRKQATELNAELECTKDQLHDLRQEHQADKEETNML